MNANFSFLNRKEETPKVIVFVRAIKSPAEMLIRGFVMANIVSKEKAPCRRK
jgi:hypothetical protein